MAVTVAQVQALDASLAAMADPAVQAAIDEAEMRVSRAAWGDAKADLGVRYLAGHILTADTPDASATVQSVSAGGVSTTFAVGGSVQLAKDLVASTRWGRRFLELRSTVFASRVV